MAAANITVVVAAAVVFVVVVVIVVVVVVGKETHTWYSTRSGSRDDYREKELCSQPYAPLSQIPSSSDQPWENISTNKIP